MSNENTTAATKSLEESIKLDQGQVETVVSDIEQPQVIKKPRDKKAPVIKEAPMIQQVRPETEYPEAQELADIYAVGLLPSNNLPASHTLQDVAEKAAPRTPIALLVDDTGEVLPPPIPYVRGPGASPLYTTDEVEKYRALYEIKEQGRVDKLLNKNLQPAYDATATPTVEDEDIDEDDMYGQPMSEAVTEAFKKAGRK